ncbi:MAG TPA: VanW family protein, partial [Bacteroidales bacterium]|nr:VanW family protein [Bacteroidales bacterium]
MKRKTIMAIILLIALSGAGAVTYRGYAVEKEKQMAETIVSEAIAQAEIIQNEQDQIIIDSWSDKVYPGVSVMGTDLSGKTREEAKNILDTEVSSKLKEYTLSVSAKDQTFPLTLAELEIVVDSDTLAGEAVKLGKDLSNEEKLSRIYSPQDEELSLSFGHNDEKIAEFIKKVTDAVNQKAKNATITRSGGSFTIGKHAEGRVVDEEKLMKDLQDAINELNPDVVVEADIVVSQPEITTEALANIDSQLSVYTTNYSSSAAGRKYNVGFAASKINGALIMPGETFSYNEEVGPVTAAAGFQNAGVYIGNKVEEGIGGGLCQVSSTLYQAALHSNLEIEQRRNHSMAVSYLKPGMDAVVYGPYLYLKFTNTYANPIYISAYGDNSNLTIAVYGHKADMGGYSYKIFSETTSVIQPKTIEKEDPTMYVGETEIEFKPVTGYTSKTYKQTIKDGKVVKTEVISQDTYKKVDQVILIGTKPKPAPAPAPKPEPTPAPPATTPKP